MVPMHALWRERAFDETSPQRRINGESGLTEQAAPARVKLSREKEAGAVEEQPAEESGMGRRNKNVSALWGFPPPKTPWRLVFQRLLPP